MSLHPQLEPNDELSRRLTRALEATPPFHIPEGFAARIAAAAGRLPAPRTTRFSTLATQISFALLAFSMLLCAPWAHTHAPTPVVIETLFALEFVALITWLSVRPHTLH